MIFKGIALDKLDQVNKSHSMWTQLDPTKTQMEINITSY